MIPMTLAEVAGVVGGRLVDGEPDLVVTVAASDDRDCVPGTLFAAIKGERVDGHDFIDGARARGAVASLTTRPVGSPAVVVPDVVLALGRLASYVIQRLPHTLVLGLSGSSGKTTTKDLLAAILAPHGVTVNCIAPGYMATDINTAFRAEPGRYEWIRQRTPMKRWGTEEDLMGAVLFLSSPASAFMTGQVVTVDGGMTIAI